MYLPPSPVPLCLCVRMCVCVCLFIITRTPSAWSNICFIFTRIDEISIRIVKYLIRVFVYNVTQAWNVTRRSALRAR